MSPVEQLRAAAERLLREGRDEGIEPDGPLGSWLKAQAEALDAFAGVLDGHEHRFQEQLDGVKAASQMELAKLATALQAADKAVERGDQAIRQARTAAIAATVQQEAVTQRMIEETLPKFADALKGALVIRETRWNRERAWRRHAVLAAAVLAVFAGGYGLCSWSDQDRLAAFDGCLAQPIVSAGRVYCLLGADPTAAAAAR